jgi:hypothetical protein
MRASTTSERTSRAEHGVFELLAGPRLGVTATARNWATVTKLLAIADE